MNTEYLNYYTDEELGAIYTKQNTEFRVWSPYAENVVLNLYLNGEGDKPFESYTMKRDSNAVWRTKIEKDLNGIYYTYTIINSDVSNETVDIYAKSTGVNGLRGMVIDIRSTDPENFRSTKCPAFNKITDAVIYELHIRDFSIDVSSGVKYNGKYLAFCEKDTRNDSGDTTCLYHMKELGITHVHLLPTFDYMTVDEEHLYSSQFNWGYDPLNYNVPEGSYSTDPFDGAVRIKEFKEMVKSLHEVGIRVVMDVVYNHTYNTENSYFNLTVPEYYYRTSEKGFSNGSGCGNETASEHPMVRKYIIDSVKYWAKEYMIDGFRFDLMAVHDIDTMNKLASELKEINSSIIIYGEGWNGGPSLLPPDKQCTKFNASHTPDIAYFSDDIRNTIKGNVFRHEEKGFVNDGMHLEKRLQIGVTASTDNKVCDYKGTDFKPWALSPCQVINYCEAHDNLTLWDKLHYSAGNKSEGDRIMMDKLAACIVFLSQGIPFIQAGQEFLRSKPLDSAGKEFDENSYKSPDSVNSIKWEQKTKYKSVFEYYRGLIELRKQHSLFRLSDTSAINEKLSFISDMPEQTIAYSLKDSNEQIIVVLNASEKEMTYSLPQGEWSVYVDVNNAGNKSLYTISEKAVLSPLTAIVLVKKA